jgi:hypothetical protein
MSQTQSSINARLSSCHGDSGVFSTVVEVTSSRSAATIVPFDSFAALGRSGQAPFDSFAALGRSGQAPSAGTDASRRIFESALERVRHSFRLQLYGFVVMPEHVHLLLSEPHSSQRVA